MTLRRVIGGAALVLTAGVAALLACEGAARFLYPPVRGSHWYHEDPRYGMRHRSSLDKQVTEWGDGAYWRFRTNARGFRGGDWADVPAPGERRVLVMGDSFTFGDGVSEGGAFPQIADRLVGSDDAGKSAHWHVLDLGVSAWGPQNALAYLETAGEPIGASCLVYAFFLGNDVIDNVAADLYSLRDGRLEKNPIVAAPPTLTERIRDIMRALPGYDFLLDHSQLFNVARAVFLRETGHHRIFADTGESYAEVPRDTYRRALDLDDATLARMAHLARDRFGGFAIMLLPELAELDGAPELHRAPDLVPADLAEQARERVRQWASANAVPVLDLVELLPHEPAAARRLYFTRDFHPNAAGQQRFGELLAQDLPRLCRDHQPLRQSAHN